MALWQIIGYILLFLSFTAGGCVLVNSIATFKETWDIIPDYEEDKNNV